MTVFFRAVFGFGPGLVLPLLFGAAAFGQGLSAPGGMSSGTAPAMPGAPIAAPGAMGSMSGGGTAPGMSANMPSAMPLGATPATTTTAPPTAPMNGTTMNGGSATNGPMMTAFHGTVYQTHKTIHETEGFLTIQNQGAGPDTLTAVSCPIAGNTLLTDASGTTLDNLDIAAGQSVVLAPKGVHLQLQNTHFQVFRGSVLPCVLTFRTFGQIQVLLYSAKPSNY